ncbi:hypothetical protein G419_05602 [Rhodococcus triatomae BKS 15-14]|nr:hypothetical protein G419_05602 [Rhodococcus triatomae BKS 15-14]
MSLDLRVTFRAPCDAADAHDEFELLAVVGRLQMQREELLIEVTRYHIFTFTIGPGAPRREPLLECLRDAIGLSEQDTPSTDLAVRRRFIGEDFFTQNRLLIDILDGPRNPFAQQTGYCRRVQPGDAVDLEERFVGLEVRPSMATPNSGVGWQFAEPDDLFEAVDVAYRLDQELLSSPEEGEQVHRLANQITVVRMLINQNQISPSADHSPRWVRTS